MTGLVAAGFRGLAALRHARAFHPAGLVLRGELSPLDDDLPWPPGPVPVVARLSKGAGTPGRLPDALGLAIRLLPQPGLHPGAGGSATRTPERHREQPGLRPGPGAPPPPKDIRAGDGGPWDITLTTAGSGHIGRMLPRPATSWTRGAYTSLVPYRRADRLIWLGAWAEETSPRIEASLRAVREAGALRFVLRTGREDGRWCDTAVLMLEEAGGPAPAFDPMVHLPEGLTMAPEWLAAVRERAYEGSRAGRP
ncbi:hypothetical protein [Amycolatopsis australiensis]|uniref:Phosphodiesterase n=1 Tax=Amycolatopsis australiensis TaxID=546364 RepID=A0A1K1SNW0_9PSEU|nr:hypothetical protein [Amycolatopsis australiensis]SFW85966.1 hypothetical protein SAMN04489730_6266 [Amycolatopsis australiensis]